MCTKPFSQTKNKGKLFWVAESSGPLLARAPLKYPFQNVISVTVIPPTKDGILHPRRVVLGLPSPPLESVRAYVRAVADVKNQNFSD